MLGNYTGKRGESNFEKDFIELLQEKGWENVIDHPTHDDLKSNLREIINTNNTGMLNGVPLTDGEFSQLMDHIAVNCNTPVAANVFLNGKRFAIHSEVDRRGHKAGEEIYLDIFRPAEVAGGHSRYQIAEQPLFATSSSYNDRRGDIMLLINGLPVIHIELKAAGVPLEEGTNQIQKYMNEGVFSGLYSLIQVFFVVTPEDAVYFVNTFPTLNPAFFFHWADSKNIQVHDWKVLVSGPEPVLSIPEAHQLVGYYTVACTKKDSKGCIENLNDGFLMVARSYQIYAIRAILRRVKLQHWGNHTPLGGFVWATTGSGKTLTSYKAGQLMTDLNEADKVVFVVDRTDLSDQSYSEYTAFARDGEPVKATENTHALFKALMNSSDRLLITTIQKLGRINEEKSAYVDAADVEKINRKRVVFIIDEAHRSQFGKMHRAVKNTFVNALFIGFTGTPIFSNNDKADGMTSETVFGSCLAEYSIASGIRDKNVLGFDPRMIKTFDDSEVRDKIACTQAGCASAAEAKRDASKWKIYQKFHRMEMEDLEKMLPASQYNSDQHRGKVMEDILNNWDSLSGGRIRFHAILATSSILEAVAYYHLFKASGSGLKVTALFDPNEYGNSDAALQKEAALVEITDDYNQMFGKGNVINRDADPKLKGFKADVMRRLSHKAPYQNLKPEEMLDIVIVVDMLLTGFDSKYVNTLYLDKELETDKLIQAISRTNRVLDFDEKPFGIFRYYRKPYTMDKNIHEALRLYCEGGEGTIVSDINENLKKANQFYQEISDVFVSSGISDFMCLPKSQTACQKFKLLFRSLSQTINGMKLQGMKWKDDNDPYIRQLACCEKWMDGKTRIFQILKYRYDDLMPAKREVSVSVNRIPYDLTASLSEVEKDKIDADYLEEHFQKTVIRITGNDINELEKEIALQEFSVQLGVLSAVDRGYAEQIIQDIMSGDLDIRGRTLRQLIAEYRTEETNKKIADFAGTYGLDEDLLKEMYFSDSLDDIKISKLLDNCDREQACKSLGCKSKLSMLGKLNGMIREFLGVAM